jgi:hypothetical protein
VRRLRDLEETTTMNPSIATLRRALGATLQ